MVSWTKGSHFKVNASVAKAVMDDLAEQDRLTPAELVEASRPESAPLHNEFEWNDTIAAQKWREQTGRVMIASIVVTADIKEKKTPVRAYFNIEHASPQYIPTEVIFSDEAKKERLLDIAKNELISFKRKYESLTELAGVMNAIDELMETTNEDHEQND